MNTIHRSVTETAILPTQTAAHDNEERLRQAARNIVAQNTFDAETIGPLIAKAETVIGALAPIAVVARVARDNPDAFWTFTKAGSDEPGGFQALLLLNAAGREAMLDGTIDMFDPPAKFLVGQSEKPAAVYVWATYALGRYALGVTHVLEHFSGGRYADVDLFSKANTVQGHRGMLRKGFTEGYWHRGTFNPKFYTLLRSPEALRASRAKYDSYVGPNGGDGIHVAHGFDDLMRVAAIRSAVYIGEQKCPFDEEFDGNDLAATHLIARKNNEPIGCLRVRFFAGFAKIERLAVRAEYRRSAAAFDLVRASIELCRMKGYRTLYGHAQAQLVNFWARFGFRPLPEAKPFNFSDYAYVEMVAEIEPLQDAVSIGQDPFLLIRPEGQWDRPGILEHSSKPMEAVMDASEPTPLHERAARR